MKTFTEWMEEPLNESTISEVAKGIKPPEGWKKTVEKFDDGTEALILSFGDDEVSIIEIQVTPRGDKMMVALVDPSTGASIKEPSLAPPEAEAVSAAIRGKMIEVPYEISNKMRPLQNDDL